jgi:glutamine synthetase adenylyltransferase
MLHPVRRTAITQSLVRSVAIAALMSAPIVATPLSMAFAQAKPIAANAEQNAETVEQRITKLHADLKITPDEEKKWNDVAQAMRDNASKMEKLIAEKRQKAPQSMTALDDLDTYQDFAQAHVDGLKNLTSSFKSLYDSMPDAQKKNADEVFANFNRAATPSHG